MVRFPWLVILAVLVMVAGGGGVGHASPTGQRSSALRTLLSTSADGIRNTARFSAPSEWRILYSYSHCQIPGFTATVEGDAFDILDVHGGSGHGTQYEHQGGSVYLNLNTACSWHVTVLGSGGQQSHSTFRHVFFSASGNGISNTRRFRAPGTWLIRWSFSHCQIPDFAVTLEGGGFDEATQAGSHGTGSTFFYKGGNVYLNLNTACDWRVQALRP